MIATSVGVFRDETRIDVAHGFEPLTRSQMQDRAVLVDDRFIRRVAYERLTEDPFVFSRDAGFWLFCNEFRCYEFKQFAVDGTSEKRANTTCPKRLSEHRCCAKNFANICFDAIETHLHNGLHCEWQVASTFRSTSNEFFQEQRVAVGSSNQVCPGGTIHAWKCGSNEAIGS